MATKKEKPFRTLLDPPVEIETPAGEEIEEVIAMKLDDDGKEEFYVAGKTNVYAKIQAEAEATKIENILAKVIQTGDTTILQKAQGQFADLTEMPKDIFEAQLKIKEAEATFNELPLEIRKAYNHNFNEYLKDAGSEHWQEVVGLKKPEIKTESTATEEKGVEAE